MWIQLKNNVIKYYGIRGSDYERYRKIFGDGDWLLSRTPIDFNRERMQEILRNISLLLKGKTKEYMAGDKTAILSRVKEIYEQLIENYRVVFGRVAKMEYVKEVRAYADIIGEDLMELRDMDYAFAKLNDYELYARYNLIRRQIGQCESILPRLVEAFRTSQVKGQFQQNFAILFERIEDLLSPVQENISIHEEEIIRLWGKGKTIPEIAKELNINVNALAVYMQEDVDKRRLSAK